MQTEKPKIFVAGSFVVGVTIGLPRMPIPGEGLIGDAFDLGPGGKGTNQAIAAARLGAEVSLLAGVGDDRLAEFADETYAREGISLDHIRRIPGVNTAIGFVMLLPGGEQSIVGHLGANLRMRPEHVDAARAAIAAADILMTQFELPIETVARALELGRRSDCLTLWNPGPAQPVSPEIFRHVDVLTPNEHEVRILLGLPPDDPTPTVDLAARLLAAGARQVVVTLGRRGALIVTAAGTLEVPAVDGVRCVDATGAGDAFNAGLAVALGEGLSLEAAARRAVFSGAYAVTRLGVIDGLPTRGELEAFTRERGSGMGEASK